MAIVWFQPQLADRWFRTAECGLAKLGRRPWLAVLSIGLVSFAACVVVAAIAGVPPPSGHDPYSYLLAGDTFSHGRLTNPPHPLWVQLESFYILQQPTYASMYPPAQGLVLALGQVVCGNPIAGVWVATGLVSAAVCWMLRAWTRPRWAVLGALLFALHPILLVWSRWYTGGVINVLGGALVLGGMRRSNGWAMGAGMAVLAVSRPCEGLVLSVAALVVWWLGHCRRHWRTLVPMVVMLTIGACWLGYYNWRVTGNALRLPYVEYVAQYGIAPPFVWMPLHSEPSYRHEVIREFFHALVLFNYQTQQTLAGFVIACWKKLVILADGLFPVHLLGLPMALITLAVVPLRWAMRDRWTRLLGGGVMIFVVGLLLESWFNVHYAAPAIGALAVLGVAVLRRVWVWRCGRRRVGRALVRWGLMGYAASVVVTVILLRKDVPRQYAVDRQHLLTRLRGSGEKQLVIVRYGASHSPEDEWVYNEADIDGACVVWAREMDEAQNQKLLDYFRDRHVWLLEADAQPPRLEPYPVAVLR